MQAVTQLRGNLSQHVKPGWVDNLLGKYKCSVFSVWRDGINSSASANKEPFTRWLYMGRAGQKR